MAVNVCIITNKKSMDQPGKVANPARGQLNREKEYNISLFPFAPDNFVSRDGSGRPILHIQAESGAYSRNSSRFPRRPPFIYTAVCHRISSGFIGSPNCVPKAFTAASPPAQGQ